LGDEYGLPVEDGVPEHALVAAVQVAVDWVEIESNDVAAACWRIEDGWAADQVPFPPYLTADENGRASGVAPFEDDGAGVDRAVEAAQSGLSVRTAFSAVLAPYAERWTRGANEAPPTGFGLSPGGLRLWAVAAGRTDDAGYVLGTPTYLAPEQARGSFASESADVWGIGFLQIMINTLARRRIYQLADTELE